MGVCVLRSGEGHGVAAFFRKSVSGACYRFLGPGFVFGWGPDHP